MVCFQAQVQVRYSEIATDHFSAQKTWFYYWSVCLTALENSPSPLWRKSCKREYSENMIDC